MTFVIWCDAVVVAVVVVVVVAVVDTYVWESKL